MNAIEIRKQAVSGDISLKDMLDKIYSDIKTRDREINAFITLTEESAYLQAAALKKKIENKEAKGKLFGVPVAVKDNMCLRGVRTTCGSKILENYIAPYDAAVIEKLKKEDAIIVGKTNMDEFAMGSSTETSHFGITRNPRDLSRIPGGSSGGSAAAIAAGFVPVALGSDTGGSIRQPASLCGVYGLKPTYGLVSRYGLIAFASSLDQIGPFTSNTEDMALVLEAIAGYDNRDSTSCPGSIPEYSKMSDLDPGLTVGIPKEYFIDGMDKEVEDRIREVIERLKSSGVKIKEISLPHTKYAVSVYYIIAPSEASANLARYDGVKYGFRAGITDKTETADLLDVYKKTRTIGFGDEVKRRIMIGTYALSAGYYDAYYRKAQKVRTLIKRDFDNAFRECQIILTPTTPETAFRFGEKTGDPLKMYLSDVFTISCNLAGIPGLSMPVGNDQKGLPVGMQLLAPHFKEQELLSFAHYIEKTLDYEL